MKKTFLLGALGYGALEILWRGRTHWSMLLAGGACLCGIKKICRRKQGLFSSALRCAGMITTAEFCIGMLVNRRYAVWDYRGRRGNVLGQICPMYSILWFALSLPFVLYYKWKNCLQK